VAGYAQAKDVFAQMYATEQIAVNFLMLAEKHSSFALVAQVVPFAKITSVSAAILATIIVVAISPIPVALFTTVDAQTPKSVQMVNVLAQIFATASPVVQFLTLVEEHRSLALAIPDSLALVVDASLL